MAKITSHDIQHKTEYRSLRKVRSSTNPSFLPTEATGQAVMYNYRDTDNELLSCVTSTLAKCRRKRNEWLDAEEGDTKKPFYLVTTLIEHYDSPPANNHSSSAFLQTLKNALVNYFIDSKQLSSLLLS